MNRGFFAVLALSSVLAVGGKNHKNASVEEMVHDEQTLLDQMAWCGRQRDPDAIHGCRNAGEALATIAALGQ